MKSSSDTIWPPIPFPDWEATCSTLHLWTQIIGKVRLALTPWINHSWHVVLYPTARGLTTSPVPYRGESFEIIFDFLSEELLIEKSNGIIRRLALRPQSVADFYADVMDTLRDLDIDVRIGLMPNEIPEAIPFDQDHQHATYDAEAVRRFFFALLSAQRVLNEFRSGFLGKVSPVHFFWGSFDLAVTRFSGRRAPLHPGGTPGLPNSVNQEAYSHEVSSAGFWPGNGGLGYPAFYSYAYPEPAGFAGFRVGPEGAFYSETMKLFLLPYEKVRLAENPEATLLQFLESTYEAAAELGAWDRSALECPRGRPGIPRALS